MYSIGGMLVVMLGVFGMVGVVLSVILRIMFVRLLVVILCDCIIMVLLLLWVN